MEEESRILGGGEEGRRGRAEVDKEECKDGGGERIEGGGVGGGEGERKGELGGGEERRGGELGMVPGGVGRRGEGGRGERLVILLDELLRTWMGGEEGRVENEEEEERCGEGFAEGRGDLRREEDRVIVVMLLVDEEEETEDGTVEELVEEKKEDEEEKEWERAVREGMEEKEFDEVMGRGPKSSLASDKSSSEISIPFFFPSPPPPAIPPIIDFGLDLPVDGK